MAVEPRGTGQARGPAAPVAGLFPDAVNASLPVGPATGREFNTIRAALIPRACFLLEESHFEFDSSFPLADSFDASPLKALMDENRGLKLSVFGHADPVGDDEYNKGLSGRRAQAVFGLLVRDLDLWVDLYERPGPARGDDWSPRSIEIMREKLGIAPTPVRGRDTATFRSLAPLYMDAICLGEDGRPFRLTRDDFLARGRAKDGKGDFQGCSEFNPVFLLSRGDRASLEKPGAQKERDELNELNRRVSILLFRAGSQVDPVRWPCPSAKQPTAGCRVRFFSDGDKRRASGPERRRFSDTKDTWACRFYQRLADASPCEEFDPRRVFQYGMEVGADMPWSEGATFRIVSEDGSHQRTFTASQGRRSGTHRVFTFPGVRKGLKYRGVIKDTNREIELFAPSALDRILDPGDPLNVLELPRPAEVEGPLPSPLPATRLDGPMLELDEDTLADAADPFEATSLPGPF